MHIMKEDTKAELSTILPYHFNNIVDDTKCLGYYINPNGYRQKDWDWILKLFDKRINQWG